jgi:DNA gyrase subunit A
MKGYEVPEFARQSKGLPIINLLPLEKEENISSIVEIDADDQITKYLMFATRGGIVKRTDISEFENIRKGGKIAIVLKEDDELISVRKTCGNNEIAIGASNGRMVRFDENEIRSMGRSSSGVKGIELDGATVVGAEVVNSGQYILIVTEKGYGKKTPIDEYRLTHRGSKGVKALNVTEKNGMLVSLKAVTGEEDLVIITDSGIIMRMSMDQISTLGRATQGVRLIKLKDEQKVATVSTIIKEEQDENENSNEEQITEDNQNVESISE